ncbi:MAG: FAD-dependent oxidoreductase [Rhizobiaceae bacterium]|nr:FAD-dependent oxidoreductase [Rhizobiaceae bacterium]
METHFDVLVIGAGSAGSVLAARLTADPACRVCLVEAGDEPADPDIADPLKWTQLQGRAYDWAYRTVPQPFTDWRVHEWPRGKVVGGSGCLHAMAYVRGHADDFDAWRTAGGERWSFESLLPAFRRSESFTAFEHSARGLGGPLDVWLPQDEVSPVVRAYIAAGQALGAPVLSDHNSGSIVGTSPNSLNIRNGRRLSVADAYLTPEVRSRPNLTILTGCEVDEIEWENSLAAGIVAVRGSETLRLSADRIVLSAGAISSPLILMRSGIGPEASLRDAGIACRLDRTEIGENLQDHLLGLGNVYRARKPVPPSRLQHSESLMYLHGDDMARAEGSPDIVLACVVAPSAAAGLKAPPYGSAYTLLFGVTHPQSRGQLRPGGPSRKDAPIIDPRYLDAEYDRATFRTALRRAREVGAHPALDEWRDAEVLPGPEARTDQELDAFVARSVSTHHHPCGTCRMGTDDDAVVDADLRVRGFDNLFVVDASIIPAIPCGPINAAVVALAEHWVAEVAGAPTR